MGIVTKIGDKGLTSLCWGGKVRKDDIRVEACGVLDELSSFLGLSKSLIKDRKAKKIIESIQMDLFVMGAEIATETKFINKLKVRINASGVSRLEEIIERLEKTSAFERHCFYLAGEDFLSSTLDIARTVARRAERGIAALRDKKVLDNPHILIYLNRVSDLLYLLARAYEKRHRKLSLK